MSRVGLAGLGLIAAAVAAVVGWVADSSRYSSVAWAIAACLAFVGVASGYRAIVDQRGAAGAGCRTLPAAGLGLMGAVASAWIVEATLRIAYPADADPEVATGDWLASPADIRSHPLSVVAIIGGGAALALFAGAVGRAGLVRPAFGRALALAVVLAALTAHPALPYLVGAAPLGFALVAVPRGEPERSEEENTDENCLQGTGVRRSR